jgi:DNA-binding response OmpR family regulator
MAPRAARLPQPPVHVLVAAADIDHLAELTFRVARLGVTVSSAADRAEVWCAVHERPPDLLVFAESLALAHDAELLRRLRRTGATARTPFVLVAAVEHSTEHAASAETPAPNGVLLYRCEWRDLETTVRRVLDTAVRRRAPRATHAGPIAVDGAIDTVAVRGTRVRVSSAELTLIRLLLQAPAGVSDAELRARLWGTRTIRRGRALVSLASRLRRKLVPLGVRLERAATVRGYLLRW